MKILKFKKRMFLLSFLGLFSILLCSIALATQPLLNVTKSDNTDPAVNGSVLVYTVDITNIGNSTAINVTLNDTLPANVSFINASTANVSESFWNFGNITVNSTTSLNITVMINANATNASILTNNVNVSYQNSTNSSNITLYATAQENTTVFVPPDFTIVKTVSASQVSFPATITYTLNATNIGSAIQVTINDIFDSFLIFSSSNVTVTNTSGQNLTWVQNVSQDETLSISVSFTLNSSIVNGTIIRNNFTLTYMNLTNNVTQTSNSVNTTYVAPTSTPAHAGGSSGGGGGGGGYYPPSSYVSQLNSRLNRDNPDLAYQYQIFDSPQQSQQQSQQQATDRSKTSTSNNNAMSDQEKSSGDMIDNTPSEDEQDNKESQEDKAQSNLLKEKNEDEEEKSYSSLFISLLILGIVLAGIAWIVYSSRKDDN